MKEAGILPSFAGIAVSDRYQNYYSATWENLAGNQACAAHLIRDFADCAETYPGAGWPEQAQRALRGLIRAWHAVREQGLPAIPAEDREPSQSPRNTAPEGEPPVTAVYRGECFGQECEAWSNRIFPEMRQQEEYGARCYMEEPEQIH